MPSTSQRHPTPAFHLPVDHDTAGKTFTIFGAGLAGTLLAVFLGRLGYTVDLYERRPDPREAGAERGRSINLALSTRGIDALEAAGVAERVLKTVIPMRGRMIHDNRGNLAYQPYGRDNIKAINSVSRAGLNQTLLDEADTLPNVTIHFARRAAAYDPATNTIELHDNNANPVGSLTAQHIIGADGAFSAIRAALQRTDRFTYSQSFLKHGYKELTIPPRPNTTPDDPERFQIEPNALHIWPRGDFMMIALPNQDGSFTCTLFWPYEGPHAFANLDTDDKVIDFFNQHFPDAVPLIPTLAHDFRNNPTSSLVTVRCEPWHLHDKVCLIGDACHAIVPFYGQGMNAAFEDCKALAAAIAVRSGNDLEAAFAHYEAQRKPAADAIADLAYENFIEMRDKAGQPSFRRKKAIERILARLLPNWYTPLYELVTFSTIPYHRTREIAARQNRIVANIATIAAVVLIVIAVAALSTAILP